MQKTNQQQKPDIVAMAKKKRHIYLLEKMQSGKTLTKSELKELENFEKKKKKAGVVYSMQEVADAESVTERTVARWKREGMPVRKDGGYELIPIHEWRVNKEKKNRSKKRKKSKHDEKFGKEQVEDDEYGNRKDLDWEWEKSKWDAILKRQKAEEAAGKLIQREDAEKALVKAVEEVKLLFLSLPQSVAPQLVGLTPSEISYILEIRIKESIEKLAKGKIQ